MTFIVSYSDVIKTDALIVLNNELCWCKKVQTIIQT